MNSHRCKIKTNSIWCFYVRITLLNGFVYWYLLVGFFDLCIEIYIFDLRIGLYIFYCVSDFILFCLVFFFGNDKSLNFEISNKKRQVQVLRDFTFLQHLHGSARNVVRIPNISSPIPGCYTLCIHFNCYAGLTVLCPGIHQLLIVDCIACFEPTQTTRRSNP